jgi:hypothetical protein
MSDSNDTLPTDVEVVDPAPILEDPAPEPVGDGVSGQWSGKASKHGRGWPVVRFHPVHGAASFDDPNAYDQAGGDEGDWRFKTAGEADAARTGTEAALANANTLLSKLEDHKNAGLPTVRNSAAAEESRKTGYPEPGLV